MMPVDAGEIVAAVSAVGMIGFFVGIKLMLWRRYSQCLPRANEVATALGASVKTHVDRTGKQYHVVGERAGYEVELIFDGRESGKIEVKPAGSRPGIEEIEAKLGGIFQHVQYDREARADAHNQLDSDHWDEGEQRKYFLSQHVYFENTTRRLRPLVTFWNQLPDELTGAILQQMEAMSIERVHLGSSVTIKVKDTAVIRPGFALQMLDLAVALATAINAPGYVAA